MAKPYKFTTKFFRDAPLAQQYWRVWNIVKDAAEEYEDNPVIMEGRIDGIPAVQWRGEKYWAECYVYDGHVDVFHMAPVSALGSRLSQRLFRALGY